MQRKLSKNYTFEVAFSGFENEYKKEFAPVFLKMYLDKTLD